MTPGVLHCEFRSPRLGNRCQCTCGCVHRRLSTEFKDPSTSETHARNDDPIALFLYLPALVRIRVWYEQLHGNTRELILEDQVLPPCQIFLQEVAHWNSWSPLSHTAQLQCRQPLNEWLSYWDEADHVSKHSDNACQSLAGDERLGHRVVDNVLHLIDLPLRNRNCLERNAPVDADRVERLRPGRKLPLVPTFWAKHEFDSISETLLGLFESVTNVHFDEYDVIDPLEYPKVFLETKNSGSACALVVSDSFPKDREEARRRGPTKHCHS